MKKKNINCIDNAIIIKIDDLPQIGATHNLYKNEICIDTKIIDFKGDYIIYQTKFCEKASLRILDDFYINCRSWLYAIKKEDLN
jgi:hypothetical protein